jgi:hypothetical protein
VFARVRVLDGPSALDRRDPADRRELVVAKRDVILAFPLPDIGDAILEDAAVAQRDSHRDATHARFLEHIDQISSIEAMSHVYLL